MARLKSGMGVFIVFLVLYIIFQNADQSVDSFAFVLDARTGIAFFHPHHLFYNALVHMFYRLSALTGLDSIHVLSAVSALFGAAALAFVYLLLKRISSTTIALTIVVGLGWLHGFWSFSASVEVNIVSIMFLAASLYLLYSDTRSPKSTILVFVLLGLGTLFHQLTALAVVPIFIYEIYRYRDFKRVFGYAVPGILSGFLIYILIAFVLAEDKSIKGIYTWLTTYGHLGYWGSIGWNNLVVGFWGIVKAIFGGDTLRQYFYGDTRTTGQYIYLALAVSISTGIGILALRSFYYYLRHKKPYFTLLVLLAAVYSVFGFWWTPTDEGFWLYPILMLMPLVAGAVNSNPKFRKLLIGTVAVLTMTNIVYEIAPASRKSNSVAINGAAALHRLGLTSDDLFLNNLMRIRSALEYYYHSDIPTSCLGFREFGPNNQVIADYLADIENVKGRVYLFEDEIKPEPHRKFMYARFSPAEYAFVYDRYEDRLTAVDSLMVYGQQVRIFLIDRNTPDSSKVKTNIPSE